MEDRPETAGGWRRRAAEYQRLSSLVVAACERYDELLEYWRQRELPAPRALAEAIGDPSARTIRVERALVGLSLDGSSRAGALLEWYDPMPGQSEVLEYVARVCRIEWRQRFGADGPVEDGSLDDGRAA